MVDEPKPGAATATAGTPDPKPAGTPAATPATETPAVTPAAATPAVPATPAEPTATPKAPEKYTLTIPADAQISERDIKRLEKAAREWDMTNDEAQELLNGSLQDRTAVRAELLAELTADPIYGGDKLAESQQLMNTVVNRVRPDGHPRAASFRAFLAQSAANNHIEVLSFLADLGKMMGEDRPNLGRAADTAAPRDAAEVLYGKQS